MDYIDMLLRKTVFFVIILLMAITSVPCQAQKPNDTLVIAISNDFQPFTFLNAEGRPAGMLVDMWRLWGQKSGKKIEFISSDWKTSLENLKNGKADIHSGLFYSPERFGWMSESQPFYKTDVRFFYLSKHGKIAGLDTLSGESVAVVRGTQFESFLQKNYPRIHIVGCDSREELVKATRTGRAKGFIAVSPVGSSLIDRLGVSGEFEKPYKVLFSEDIHPGILKGNEELRALVEKGLNAISNQEWANIEAHWIQDPAKRQFKPASLVDFTPAEKGWIANHKTIRVGMSPVFPPLKFRENGLIKGIEPDYLQLLSEYTGLNFQNVICDFSSMDAKVKSGEIDMFISFNIPDRLAYMIFTEPLMEFKQVIVARNDTPFLSGVGALKGKKIATVKGVKLYDKILANYPGIEAVQVDTMEQMFRAVSEHKADALISKTIFTGYIINNYPNLKIAGIADLPPEPYLYAVRKDYPELVGILNKAIVAIPKERHEAIVQKWVTLRLEYRPNWVEIRKWVLAAGGGVAIILSLTFYWNRRLAREIIRQGETELALQETNKNLESLFNNANAPIIVWDTELRITRFNRAFETLTGRRAADVTGNHISLFFPPAEKNHSMEMIARTTIAGVSWEAVEIPIQHADGSVRTVLWNSATIHAADGVSAVATIAQGLDITELRAHILKERRIEEMAGIREAVEGEERARLARELHDGSGQSLQAIRLHLKLLAAGKGGDNMLQELNQLAQEVADTAGELREISHQLRPSYLRKINLDVAVFNRCEMLRRRGAPVEATCVGDFSGIPYGVGDNFYRILQESLANAVRHADAGQIKVYLTRGESALRLVVSDDGCGMAERDDSDGTGLCIMHERAALIDASLTIASDPKGTTVTLTKEEA